MVYRRYTPGQVPLAHPGHHETKAPTPSRTVRKIEIQASSIPGGRHCQLQTASLTDRNLCVSFLFEDILWQSTIAMENYAVFFPSSVGKWANQIIYKRLIFHGDLKLPGGDTFAHKLPSGCQPSCCHLLPWSFIDRQLCANASAPQWSQNSNPNRRIRMKHHGTSECGYTMIYHQHQLKH